MSQVISYPGVSSNTFLGSCQKNTCHAHSWPWEFEQPVNCLTCTTLMCEWSQRVCPKMDICSHWHFGCASLHMYLENTLANTWHVYMEWFECNKICLHVCVTFFFLSLKCAHSGEVQIYCLFHSVYTSFSWMCCTNWLCGCLFAKAQPGL